MSLLWKMKIKGQPFKSYLFGTMHLKDERAFIFRDEVLEKIMECEAFATEFNLDESDEARATMYMNLPEGLTLEEVYAPEKYEKINQFLMSNFGLPLAVFNKNKPLIVSNFITNSLFQKDQAFSLDEHLFRFAKEQHKEVLGIETFDEQLEIFQKISLRLQANALYDMVSGFEEHRSEMYEITRLYQNQEVKSLYKLAKKGVKGIRKIMIFDRNEIMANRIFDLIQQKPMCIAIGAGHLAGRKGVVKLLKKQGVHIKPVSLKKIPSK